MISQAPQPALEVAVLVPHQEKVLQRPDAVVLAEAPVVAALVARQEVADLDVGAVVVQIAAAGGRRPRPGRRRWGRGPGTSPTAPTTSSSTTAARRSPSGRRRR